MEVSLDVEVFCRCRCLSLGRGRRKGILAALAGLASNDTQRTHV